MTCCCEAGGCHQKHNDEVDRFRRRRRRRGHGKDGM